MEVDASLESEEDLYATLKELQRAQEFLDIQEEYIKDEMKNLKRELIRAKEVGYNYYHLCMYPSFSFFFYTENVFE